MLVLLTTLLSILTFTHAKKDPRQINPVSVLLPYTDPIVSDHRVNVTLQAFGGCYRWKVQRPSVVRIRDPKQEEIQELLLGTTQEAIGVSTKNAHSTPSGAIGGEDLDDSNECHNAVVVSQWIDTSSNDAAKQADKSWVFAEDQHSSDGGVKCEIHIAPIEKIVIETTARSLTVGGVETLKIKGLDAQDNVFTSLEGLRFEWELEDPKVLSIASLQNDVYRPSHVRRKIHEKGEQSDIILLKGLDSGRTIVRARLIEPGYERVKAAEVWLDVIEPLVAVPSTLVVPPLAEFDVGVKVLKGKDVPSQAPLVKLPNRDFVFSPVDSPYLSVHSRNGRVVVDSQVGVNNAQVVAVADQRNNNNTDSSLIMVRDPVSIKIVQGPLGAVAQIDEALLITGKEPPLLGFLEQFAEEQYTPRGNAAKLAQTMRTFGGASKPIWYLPLNKPAILSMELSSSDSEQIYIPHNAAFEVDTFSEAGNAPALMPILWKSQNQALALVKPTKKEFGIIRASFKGVTAPDGSKQYTPPRALTVNQKYVVVDPIRIQGLPEMRGEQQSSPVPIVLPQEELAQFLITGGSGNYRLSSNDPELCSVRKQSGDGGPNLVLSTGTTTGMTVLTIMDELNPSNFYRIHCIVAPVGSIAYSPASNQVPLKSGEPTIVPIEAIADVPEQVWQDMPSSWMAVDPRRRSPEDSTDFDARRHLFAFTQCKNIRGETVHGDEDDDSTTHPAIDKTSRIEHTSSRPDLVLKPIAPNALYTCGAVEVSSPEEPTTVQLFAALGDKIKASIDLEFFANLQAHIPALDSLNRLNLEAHSSAAPPTDFQLSSPRMTESVAAAVGAPFDVHLVGGPSVRAGCERSVSASARQQGVVSIVPLKGIADHPFSIKDGSFQITCLDVATMVEIDFTIHSSCAESPLHTQLLMGCSVPDVAKIVPDDSKQGYRLDILPPTQNSANWKIAQNIGDAVPVSIGDSPKDSRVFMTCGGKHEFQLVAWDSYKRPLLALGPFKTSWAVLSSTGERNDARISYGSTNDRVRVSVGDQLCRGESELAAVLKYNGELPTQVTQRVSRNDINALKQTLARTPTLLTSRYWHAMDPNRPQILVGIETPITAPLRLAPAAMKDTSLVLRNDWAYRVISMLGSGRTRYSIVPQGERTSSTPPQILSIEHFAQLSSLPPRHRAVPPNVGTLSGGTISAIIDLVDWNGHELSQPISSKISANPLSLEFPVHVDDVLIRPESAGSSILVVEDRALLGGQPIHLPLRFEPVTSLQLELWEDVDDTKWELRASSRDPTVKEIETETVYKLRSIAYGRSGPFAPGLSKYLEAKVNVSPSRDVSVSLSDASDPLTSHTLLAKKTGKYTVSSALPSKDRLAVTSPAFEVLVHQPLRVTPSELILLPGGHSWELKVEGGGTSRRTFNFQTSDPAVVETPSASETRPVLRSNGRGQAVVQLVRNHPLSQESSSSPNTARERAATVSVTVAQPARTGIIANGQVYTNAHPRGSLLTFPVKKVSRIRGTLLTNDHRQFTLGHLALPAGARQVNDPVATGPLDATSQTGYTCKYTWSSDSPRIISFVDEDEDREATNVNDLKVTYSPPLKPKITGQNRLAATIVSREPGSVRLTFTADCADRQRWGAPFSKWSDSTTIAVVVSEDESGLIEIQDKHQYHGIRVPIIEVASSKLSILPSLAKSEGAVDPSDDLNGGVSYVSGEPMSLLPQSQYLMTPKWTGKWNFNLLCPEETQQRVVGDSKSCGVSAAVTNAVQISVRDEGRSSLVVTTGSKIGAETSISFRGVKASQVMHLPVVLSDATEIQIVPITSISGGAIPLATAETVKRPVRIQPYETRAFRVVLRDAQKRTMVCPQDLDLSVITSHPSVVDVAAEDTETPAGVFEVITGHEGCASITASVNTDAGRLSDVITICSERPLGPPPLEPVSPATPEELKRVSNPPAASTTRSVKEDLVEGWKTLISPWFVHYHISAPWVMVLCVGVVSLALTISQARADKAGSSSASSMISSTAGPNSPHRKSGSGLARDWVTTATPLAPRSVMTAFPSARRTYAPPPETRSSRCS